MKLSFVLLAIVACSKTAAPAAPQQKAGPRSYRVTATTVAPRPIVYAIEAVGSLEPYQVVTVPARVEGVLEKLDFDEGTSVTPDKVLAVVDERRYSLVVDQAEAAVRQAEAAVKQTQAASASAAARTARVQAELDEATSNWTRWSALRAKDPGFVAEEKIVGVEASVKRLHASLDEAKAGEREAAEAEKEAAANVESRRATVAIAQKQVGDARVRSPIAGTVEEKHVAAGQYVKVGERIATLVDASRLRLRFAVSDTESVQLKVGQRVSFRVKAFPDREFQADLIHIDATANPTTRMVDCLAAIDAPDPLLRPGFFAQVSVQVSRTGESIVVPDGSLLPTEKGFVGFVVKDGKAAQRLLTLGLHTKDGGVEVLSGLASGDRLVVNGAQSLQDGVPVEVVEEGVRQ